jgi:hypothetical protein
MNTNPHVHTYAATQIHSSNIIRGQIRITHANTNTKTHKTCITCRQSFTSTITRVIQSLLLYRAPCVHQVLLPRQCLAKQARFGEINGRQKMSRSGEVHFFLRTLFSFKFEIWRLVTSATGRVRSCLLHYAQVRIDALILKSMATWV